MATLLVGSLWESNSSHRPEAPFRLRASELNILLLEACDPDLLNAGAFLLFRNQLKMFTFQRLFASSQTKAAVAVTSAVGAEHCHSVCVPIVYLSPSHPWPGGSRRRELAFVFGLLLLRIIIYISIHMYSMYVYIDVVCACTLSHWILSDSVTPWTVARQAALSMGFSRQEDWGSLPCPSLVDLSDPGIGPASPALAGGFFTTELPGKPLYRYNNNVDIVSALKIFVE